MNKKEELEDDIHSQNIDLQLADLPHGVSGFFYEDSFENKLIVVNQCINTQSEVCCVLAEELGHYHTSCGDLLSCDTDKVIIQKQENKARRWAHERLVSLDQIIKAYNAGARNRFELSQYIAVTEKFLDECIDYYKIKYGLYKALGAHIIYFDPLGVFKKFE